MCLVHPLAGVLHLERGDVGIALGLGAALDPCRLHLIGGAAVLLTALWTRASRFSMMVLSPARAGPGAWEPWTVMMRGPVQIRE